MRWSTYSISYQYVVVSALKKALVYPNDNKEEDEEHTHTQAFKLLNGKILSVQ